MGARPPAGERVRAAPVTVWAYGVLALAAVPYVGIVVNRYAATDPGAWYGVGFALLLGAGLVLRWRFVWFVAFVIDGYLLLTGLWAATAEPAVGAGLAAKAVAGWALLLAPATRLHLFGSVEWRDPEATSDEA